VWPNLQAAQECSWRTPALLSHMFGNICCNTICTYHLLRDSRLRCDRHHAACSSPLQLQAQQHIAHSASNSQHAEDALHTDWKAEECCAPPWATSGAQLMLERQRRLPPLQLHSSVQYGWQGRQTDEPRSMVQVCTAAYWIPGLLEAGVRGFSELSSTAGWLAGCACPVQHCWGPCCGGDCTWLSHRSRVQRSCSAAQSADEGLC
jgi:hypothetical protein